jgi:ribosomal protein S12 methylthiotransferase accessory factor
VLTAAATRFVARVNTRLDELGLPTVSVTRRDPLGESVSVTSGKGDTARAARVSALAEALERYCAEPRGRLEIVTRRVDELSGRVLAPSSLIATTEIRTEDRLDWCHGMTLHGEPIWVPVNAVEFPINPARRPRPCSRRTPTGSPLERLAAKPWSMGCSSASSAMPTHELWRWRRWGAATRCR